MFDATEAWKERYPSAHAGLLVMDGVENPPTHPELERLKNDLENMLRARFAGYNRGAIEKLSTVAAYRAYYGQFRKSVSCPGPARIDCLQG